MLKKRKGDQNQLFGSMHFPFSYSQPIKILLILLFSIFFLPLSLSDPRISLVSISCKNSQLSFDESLIPKYHAMMKALQDHVVDMKFGTHSIASPTPIMFGLAQCHKDLSKKECHSCFNIAKEMLNECILSTGGTIFLDGCFIRFDNYNFFDESISKDDNDTKNCGKPSKITQDKYMRTDFATQVGDATSIVTLMAVVNKGFGESETKSRLLSVYILGQCWNTLDQKKCAECLNDTRTKISRCVPGAEGRATNADCYLRYSTHKFFNDGAFAVGQDDHESTRVAVIVASALLASTFFLFAAFGAYISYKIHPNRIKAHRRILEIPLSSHMHKLNFKYEILEQATEGFNPSNKLGEGGAGSVYKGILPDGNTIAVKRLFFSKRQWADEFFNEVNLISGIEHKNLVKLLGCSIEGPESLLVYEYIPNRNLDQLLYDKSKPHSLNWQHRFDIILGIAEGLAYLHGGCQEKIIHRDIKNSNILLDDNLTAKIADFGLARRVASNRTHVSTGIAGTLGYMAPEYLVKGCLTEKADVYAFGVVILEIARGRKNNVFVHDSGSVLQSVWKDYKSNSITQSIDSRLNGNFDKEQASHVLQIGLLCTQTRRSLRPSMSEVLQMLTNAATSIRLPAQPPFQNSSLLATKSTTKSSTLNSSLSSSWHSDFGTSNIGSSQFGSPYSSGSHSSDILMPERSKYSRPT